MNAKQKLHQIHLQEWTVRFADQKASGLTVRQWCEQNNLSFHTYNYWKHLLKEEVVDQALPDIVPLSLPALSNSDSSLETTVPEIRSIRANRAIRSNGSNIKRKRKILLRYSSIRLYSSTNPSDSQSKALILSQRFPQKRYRALRLGSIWS